MCCSFCYQTSFNLVAKKCSLLNAIAVQNVLDVSFKMCAHIIVFLKNYLADNKKLQTVWYINQFDELNLFRCSVVLSHFYFGNPSSIFLKKKRWLKERFENSLHISTCELCVWHIKAKNAYPPVYTFVDCACVCVQKSPSKYFGSQFAHSTVHVSSSFYMQQWNRVSRLAIEWAIERMSEQASERIQHE